MKTRGFFSWRFCLPIFVGVPLCLLATARKRHQVLYPYSVHFISASTGKPVPKLKGYLSQFTRESSDKSNVTITLGFKPNEVEDFVLGYISPVIRTHPTTRAFVISWGNGRSDSKLTYQRSDGTLIETVTFRGKSQTKILGRNLTDLDIHKAAATDKSYRYWAGRHWKQ